MIKIQSDTLRGKTGLLMISHNIVYIEDRRGICSVNVTKI